MFLKDTLVYIIVILLILWLAGFIFVPVLGWLVHVLLIVAIIMILWRIIKGK